MEIKDSGMAHMAFADVQVIDFSIVFQLADNGAIEGVFAQRRICILVKP